MNNTFYIGVGLFLLISILISTIIVFFMSRISRLEAILEQAKAVDNAKEERMSEFYEAFQEERSKNMSLDKELEYFFESKERIKEYESKHERLKERIVDESREHLGAMHEQKAALEQLSVHYDLLEQSFTKQEESHNILAKRNEDLVGLNNTLHLKVRETEIKLKEQQKKNHAKIQIKQEYRGDSTEEFAKLVTNVFEGNSKEFSKLSRENLSSLIRPMKLQISEFKKEINILYSDESKERTILKQEIMSIKELNQQISQDAMKLTKALNGEKKQQGIWSEMILEKILESSGLSKGVEYTSEVGLRNDDGKSYRPEVLVHLPDNRDLIIDAKTSLVAYEKCVNSENEEERVRYLNYHVQGIRKHIRTLGEKNYDKLLGINTLDFIFMFIPVEEALVKALEHDLLLYDDALKKQILLVGPTTLFIGLRAIENVWKHEKQTQNAKEITRRAGALHDKFVNFSDDMIKLSKQFDILQDSFESAKKRLNQGKSNIARQV